MNTEPNKVNDYIAKMDVTERAKEPFHSRFAKWNKGS